MEATSTPSMELYSTAPPPPSIRPDFVHPPSDAWQVYVTAGVCLPLMILFAALRLYAKVFLLKSRSKADYACIIGLAAGITYISITVAAVYGGFLGKHQWDVDVGQTSVEKLRLELVIVAMNGPLIWLVKLSLFLMLLELFGLLTWLRVSVWLGIVLTGLFYNSYSVAVLVLCVPRGTNTQLSWLEALSSPKCLANRALLLPVGIVNVISDVYLMLIPLPIIWGLQLPLVKKLGVSSIFLTGLIAVICSILGIKYRLDEMHGKDDSWTIISLYIVTMLEAGAGVVVSCMPATAAIFQHYGRRNLASYGQQRSSCRPIELGPARNESQAHLKNEISHESIIVEIERATKK